MFLPSWFCLPEYLPLVAKAGISAFQDDKMWYAVISKDVNLVIIANEVPIMFHSGKWCEEIHVRDFITRNYTPYDGDASFLSPPTDGTRALWAEVEKAYADERAAGGVLDIDTETISTISSHAPGYIDENLEKIVGLQTDGAPEACNHAVRRHPHGQDFGRGLRPDAGSGGRACFQVQKDP
jgi:hypothetical protein